MRTINHSKRRSREHINSLTEKLEAERARADRAEERIEAAERAERNLTIEKDRWKRRAKELEARSKSLEPAE
ncbi:MAG: hypothetical protein AAF709_22845 [Pseudomonadota bacterium]